VPAALGDAELRRQLRAVEQVEGGGVEDDQLKAERGPVGRQGNVVSCGVELERPLGRLLAEPLAARHPGQRNQRTARERAWQYERKNEGQWRQTSSNSAVSNS
jgi:hypothetical protein